MLVTLLILIIASVNAQPLENLEERKIFTDLFKKVPSLLSGKRLTEWNKEAKINPEELGEYFEGDILNPEVGRNGIIDQRYRWKGAVIPYVISGPFSNQESNTIYTAMEQYHKYTCIRFRPRVASDVDYINIQNTKTGCYSMIGRIGGQQDVNLQSPGCLTLLGTVIHELMHSVGFFHEQSRTERDKYVVIYYKNIIEKEIHNFDKYGENVITSLGVPYDYNSVMHYSRFAFTKNGLPTIEAKQQGVTIGQRVTFAWSDIYKINRMYGCTTSGKPKPAT